MSRLRDLSALSLLVLAGACASARQPGALSALDARVTNEVIGQDSITLDGWSRRVAALRQGGDVPSGRRAYAIERAAAWLGLARDSYAWDPRDAAADSALAETRRLVLALESGAMPEPRPLPDVSDPRARPDLWAALARAREGQAAETAPRSVATAEVALVRAARLVAGGDASRGARAMPDAERECERARQVATAERLLQALSDGPPAPVVALAPPPPVALAVALQGEPTMAPVARQPAAPAPALVRRTVHFALGSSALALSSRVTLGEVIAMLRTHPGVNVVIEGYTDVRGNSGSNRELAVRRADAVRQYLDAAKVALGRVTIAGIGADSAAAAHASAEAFARDRRVTLTFTDADGTPLSPAAYQMYDVDHERDLQVEQRQPQPTPRRPARASVAPAASRPLPR